MSNRAFDDNNLKFLGIPELHPINYARRTKICGWSNTNWESLNNVEILTCAPVFIKEKDYFSVEELATDEYCASDRGVPHQIGAGDVSAFCYIHFKQSYLFMTFVIFFFAERQRRTSRWYRRETCWYYCKKHS